jgi:hypothetical protein
MDSLEETFTRYMCVMAKWNIVSTYHTVHSINNRWPLHGYLIRNICQPHDVVAKDLLAPLHDLSCELEVTS